MPLNKRDRKRLDEISDGKCSICKRVLEYNDYMFTYVGCTSTSKKLHVTSEECCLKKLEQIVMIGVYGDCEHPEFKKALMKHPLKHLIPKTHYGTLH